MMLLDRMTLLTFTDGEARTDYKDRIAFLISLR